MPDASGDNCGTGAGGFKSGNKCAAARRAMAGGLDRLGEHEHKSIRGDNPPPEHATAAREQIGRAAGELAADLPAEPTIDDADAKTVKRAYVVDLAAYPEGPARDGMAALAAKAGAIAHDLGPGVAMVTAKGEAGKLLRKMQSNSFSDTIISKAGTEGAETLWERAESPGIEAASGAAQYKQITAGAWLKGGATLARIVDDSKVPADVKAKSKPAKPTAALSVAVLNLHADGEGKALPLGLQGYPTSADGVPIFYRRVKAARVGKWVHRGTGEAFEITPQRADEWVRNVKALSAAGVKPFVPGEHRDTPNAADNFGYVVDVARDGADVYATLALYGDAARQVAARNSRSIYVVKDARDANGTVYPGETIAHIALVPNPALPDLGGTVAIAASAGGTVNAKVYELAADAPVKSSRLLAALSRPSRLMLALSA